LHDLIAHTSLTFNEQLKLVGGFPDNYFLPTKLITFLQEAYRIFTILPLFKEHGILNARYLISSVTIEQTLKTEIDESKIWLDRETEESTYKRDLQKRIELINWILENMKNPNVQICNLIESKMNEIIDTINKTYSLFEADKLQSELMILDWILYLVCINEK
jgi:uncharacterized protein YicC (UPF0701 family)